MPRATELVERYVAVWNEENADARRAAIRELWAQDGTHILQPPQEILDTAAGIGFINPVLEARGHFALDARITRAYNEFVATGQFRFRVRADAIQLGEVVKFGWEMVPAAAGDPVGAGLEFLILDAEGLIRADYQFIEP